MQSELPKPQREDTYKPFEFTEFIQDNWPYLVIVLVMIYIVVMYSKILKDRKKNREDE
jgi:hypothetical protein